MELKVIAFMNSRIGPDRVGPAGAAHSVVAGLKVLLKEDFTPNSADRLVFTWAPVIVFLTSVMTFLVIPFGPGLYGQDFNIGLLYLFAVGGMTVVGLLLAGWSSFNKYSLLGGLRSAAQAVSYEIPLTLSVVGLILLAGTMSLISIAEQQGDWFGNWFVFRQPLGALIFFIAATAEANRTPFDLTEADSEIVAGFATEYSGMRFGFLFFAEYVNVFIVSALIVTLFFGAWNAPVDIAAVLAAINGAFGTDLQPLTISLDPASLGIGLLLLLLVLPVALTLLFALPLYLTRSSMPAWQALVVGFVLFNVVAVGAAFTLAWIGWDWVAGLVWFMIKSFIFVFVFVWMRATFPRVRIDHLMGFAWKWLLPASLLNLFLTATAIVVVKSLQGS
jgi:NADH:ubiquinone oxidoreductase subunit H